MPLLATGIIYCGLYNDCLSPPVTLFEYSFMFCSFGFCDGRSSLGQQMHWNECRFHRDTCDYVCTLRVTLASQTNTLLQYRRMTRPCSCTFLFKYACSVDPHSSEYNLWNSGRTKHAVLDLAVRICFHSNSYVCV